MTDNTLTLALEGDVTIAELGKAINHLTNLIDLLSREVAPEVTIRWLIEDLQAGSSLVTVVGEAEYDAPVLRVVESYARIGQSLEHGGPPPYTERIQHEAVAITRILQGNITAVRFETASADSIIYSETVRPDQRATSLTSFGAVRGRVQTISSRGKLKFTLYDLVTDKPVTCYLQDEQRDQMIDVWGREVVVTGRITRSADAGRPQSIREVTRIETLRRVDPQSYLELRGSVPWDEGDEGAEVTIRRIRDAEDEVYLRG